MDVEKIADFYQKEIKSYSNGRDSYFLTRLQKKEIDKTLFLNSKGLARQYALELKEIIYVLKSEGLL